MTSDIYAQLIHGVLSRCETELLAGHRELHMATEARSLRRSSRADEVRLEPLQRTARACTACALHRTRTNVVFGAGDPCAQLMFIGEAPGHDEDLQGLPFVGRAGQLLTKIIEAIGMKREEVYIANVLKCRPPQNRNPLPEEIMACRHFLQEQIACIRPAVIVTLGKFAAETLLATALPISRLRGQFQDLQGIPLMPTYHPAYLLRNPADKRLVWEDMKKVRALLQKKKQ